MPVGPAGNPDQVAIQTDTVQQAGKNIYDDVQGPGGLKDYIDGQWKNFQSEVTDPNLPMCLRNDFNNFQDSHKPKLDKWIENRTKIAQTLQQSATLWDFQEAVTAQNFNGPNIYSNNNYYTSPNETNPTNVEPPLVPGEPPKISSDAGD